MYEQWQWYMLTIQNNSVAARAKVRWCDRTP